MTKIKTIDIYKNTVFANWERYEVTRSRVQIPARVAGEYFSPGVNFLCWLLYWYPFHPRVTAVACKTKRPQSFCQRYLHVSNLQVLLVILISTAVAHKRPWSFCQKCKWLVTAKHARTLRMWLCMKWHGAWLYGVHRTRRDGSSFMWHQPCQRCKYTTSVDIKKMCYKKLFTCVESHASAVSLLKSGE